jgi:hypothetical protein
MWKDPIVEEIHAVREQIARECGDDLKQIMAYLRSREAMTPGRLVRKDELPGRAARDQSLDAPQQEELLETPGGEQQEDDMWKDPIVEEIHAVREQIARECNYDLGEIMARLRNRQEANAGPIVCKEHLARRKAGLEARHPGHKDAA